LKKNKFIFEKIKIFIRQKYNNELFSIYNNKVNLKFIIIIKSTFLFKNFASITIILKGELSFNNIDFSIFLNDNIIITTIKKRKERTINFREKSELSLKEVKMKKFSREKRKRADLIIEQIKFEENKEEKEIIFAEFLTKKN
jgi:hypothetical protein